MRSLPTLVAVGLVVLSSFAAAVVSSPFDFLGEARGGENQSSEDLASSAPTPDSGGGTVVATIPVGTGPTGVGYDSGNGYVYVANWLSGNVSVINGTRVVATIPVGTNPQGVGFDAGNGYVYVTNSYSGTTSVINGTTVVATVPVGDGPVGVGYDSETGYIYVANVRSNNVSVINGTTVVATVPVGYGPDGVGYDSGNGYVYVANAISNTVSVINGTTVVATVSVGSGPVGVGYDDRNGYVYVANTGWTTVSVINGTTVVATVSVGNHPVGVGYDSGNGYVYVANSNCNGSPCPLGTTSVINGTTVVATVPVGDGPDGVGYDSGNGYVYVANYISNTVSVISTTAPPTFDFSLSSPSPGSLSVVRGGTSPSSSITATLIAGSAVPVSVTANLPPGVTAFFTNDPCNPTCTVTVSFAATAFATTGTIAVPIDANGGGQSHSVSISLKVSVPPDFYLSSGPVLPSSMISAGSQGTSTITVTALGGFTGTVSLSVSASSPSGLTCTFPSSVSFGSSPQTAALSCLATAAGNYTVAVTGTSGSLTHTTSSILFHVVPVSLPPSSPSTFFGLPAAEGYALLAGITIAAVAVGVVFILRRVRPKSGVPPGRS